VEKNIAWTEGGIMLRKILVTLALGMGVLLLSESFPSVTQGALKEDHGKKLYMQYCASCHGVDGKGGGPAAAALKVLLNDLTTLQRREGKFNTPKVQNIISGEMGVLGHGSEDMPVWGRIFRRSKGTAGAGLEIYALSKYLESIQQN
jgi:mono/diheme cytochrome c family protein